jgi:hypothetical protein
MKRRTFAKNSASVLNGLGYAGIMTEWLWTAVIILPPLFKAGVFDFLVDQPSKLPDPVVHHADSSPFMIALASFITLIVLGITVYILIRLPVSIVKTGDKVTEKASAKLIPIVVHHKPVGKVKNKRLTLRLKFYLCLTASLLPIAIVPFAAPVKAMPSELVVLVAAFLAFWNLIFFSGAYYLSTKR